MRCRRCQGQTEPIRRFGKDVIWFCRPCKLSHDQSGRLLITSPELRSSFNPLQKARATIKAAHPTMAAVGKTALEAALIQVLQESYLDGLKDGILLAYSQDYEEGQPYDEPVQSPANHPREGS